MGKEYIIKPNKILVAKAEEFLQRDFYDKYQYFKGLNKLFNEIIEYRDQTFKEATDYLSNHYPLVQSVRVQLDVSIERTIEKATRNIFD